MIALPTYLTSMLLCVSLLDVLHEAMQSRLKISMSDLLCEWLVGNLKNLSTSGLRVARIDSMPPESTTPFTFCREKISLSLVLFSHHTTEQPVRNVSTASAHIRVRQSIFPAVVASRSTRRPCFWSVASQHDLDRGPWPDLLVSPQMSGVRRLQLMLRLHPIKREVRSCS